MAGPEVLEVVATGLIASVQDGGRPALAAEGVTRGGAADTWSLAVANLLLGNPPDAAAIELTLPGAAVRALQPVTVALAGTIAARVDGAGRAVEPGTAIELATGAVLAIDGALAGARSYLAVPGGIDVPDVLGSRSTALRAGFGGFEGRALRVGDRLRAAAADPVRAGARWPGPPAPPDRPIRFLPGPHAGVLGEAAVEALLSTRWTVAPASDRIGLRLDGDPLPGDSTGELATLGVVAGAIQVPPDRRPIVLLADHQPTGGYPVVAVAITADLPRLGQLAPGAVLRFEGTTAAAARDALLARHEDLRAAAAALGDATRWDDLWRWARG